MELIINGSRAICPICSGLVHGLVPGVLYRCLDCRILYQVTGDAYAETALKVKTVKEC